jgi:hypothetical protein
MDIAGLILAVLALSISLYNLVTSLVDKKVAKVLAAQTTYNLDTPSPTETRHTIPLNHEDVVELQKQFDQETNTDFTGIDEEFDL